MLRDIRRFVGISFMRPKAFFFRFTSGSGSEIHWGRQDNGEVTAAGKLHSLVNILPKKSPLFL
jgi:hypothetical protein